MGDRHATAAGLSAAEPSGRARLGVRVDRLPRQPADTPGRTTSSTSSGRWRGSRRTSPTTAVTRISLRSPAVRRAVICASLAALTPNDPQWQPGFEDADTSVVAAVPIYGRYDWFTAKGSGRKEFIAFLQKFVVKKPFAEQQAGVPRRVTDQAVTPRRATVFHPARRGRLDHPGAARAASSPRRCGRCRRPPSRMPRSRTPSTRSTSTTARRAAHYTAQAVEEFLSWVHAKRARPVDMHRGRVDRRHSGSR